MKASRTPNRIRCVAAGLTIVLLPVIGWAQLTVIFDNGATQLLAPFLEPFAATVRSPEQHSTSPDTALGAADLASLLPIRSPGLTPGPVEAKSQDRPLATPFFLIGTDARSRQWLADNRARLVEIGAVGMLVEAESPGDLKSIADLTAGLPVTPASGTDLAKVLGIHHYPVLITAHGIEQ